MCARKRKKENNNKMLKRKKAAERKQVGKPALTCSEAFTYDFQSEV